MKQTIGWCMIIVPAIFLFLYMIISYIRDFGITGLVSITAILSWIIVATILTIGD